MENAEVIKTRQMQKKKLIVPIYGMGQGRRNYIIKHKTLSRNCRFLSELQMLLL